MIERRHETYLLTPGPVTVAPDVKREMLLDRSPNSASHNALVAGIQSYLLEICNGSARYAAVPMQGSASFAIEAAFQTLIPRDGRLLVIRNGFYGGRLVEIAQGIGLSTVVLDLDYRAAPSEADVEAALDAHPGVTHIVFCHVDTATGILNPIEPVADVARRRGVALFVDAVASFGGFPIDVEALSIQALMLSPNKGLEGVPGLGFVVCRRDALAASAGRSPSMVLDLHAQWALLEEKGMWRFTPPTHIIGALAKACERHRLEGGVAARHARYRRNWRRLVDGLRQRGLTTLLPDSVAAPIIATFHDPVDPRYDFNRFQEAMERRGVLIFPGRLTAAGTFRMGCMGDIEESDISIILDTVDQAFAELGLAAQAA